jgi:hypothetical protein
MSGAKIHDGGGNPGASGHRGRSPHPSTLPPEVDGFIEQVIRGTRLRKAERDDVRAELTSHFAEALASGASAAAAMASYGDPKDSARALRAAAIAKRSAIDRAFGRALVATGWTVGVVVGAYVLFALYLAANAPRPSFDPIERVAERLPVAPPDQVAWASYRKILPALGLTGHQDGANATADRIDAGPGWPGRKPTDEAGATWDEQVAWCDTHSADLARLRAASALPVLGFPYATGLTELDAALFEQGVIEQSQALIRDKDRPWRAFGIMLPHLASVRQCARVLALDATVAASRGQGAAAVDDLAAIVAMSMQVQQPRFLICDLVAVAMRAVAAQRAVMLLEAMPDAFTDADLARLQAVMRSVPAELAMLELWGERIGFEDAVQWVYSDDGDGDGFFNPTTENVSMLSSIDAGSLGSDNTMSSMQSVMVSLVRPGAAIWMAGRKDMMDFYDRWCEELTARRDWTLGTLATAAPTQTDAPLRAGDAVFKSRYLLAALLLPAIDKANTVLAADRAQREAVDVAAACVRFRRAKGAWPTSVAALVPAYLPSTPVDPWSGKAPGIKGDGATFLVWSVGEDMVDQGGDLSAGSQSPRARQTSGPERAMACDWVWFAPTGSVDRWFQE